MAVEESQVTDKGEKRVFSGVWLIFLAVIFVLLFGIML